MTRKFGLSVVAATLLATGIQAAEVTAPHNNLSVWGGVSASLTNQSENIQGNGTTEDTSYFCLDTAVIGATVKADESNPFGGTVVAGNFAVKTVTGAKVAVKDPVTGESNFRVWLGHIDYTPVSNLMVNAGLIWQNFGEKPVDALNAHMTRTTDFVFQPVAMAGLRLSYDMGMAKVYAGLNDGSVLGGSHTATSIDVDGTSTQKGFINVVATSFGNAGGTGSVDGNTVDASTSGMEAGAMIDVGAADIGLNYFSQSGDGMSTMNASVKEKVTGFDVALEINQHAAATMASGNTADALLGTALATSAGAAAYDLGVSSMKLNANIKLADNFSIPVRYDTTTITLDAQNSAAALATDSFTISALTVTPTYNPTPASFIRAEIVSTTSNEEVFVSGKNDKATDSRSTVALEFGVLF